jgi:NADP-dependent 3-hydroxy acid dehydrogenase YdfG
LVTGASRGIGRETSLRFAQAGAHVAALARTSSAIDSLVSEIKMKYNVPAVAIAGDVLGDAPSIIKEVEAELGPVDILINNAGKNRMARFTEEKDLSNWWRVFEINTLAPLALVHALLPSFLARRRGTIITVGSAVADAEVPFLSSYVGSKAAVQKAIQILDSEVRAKGVQNFVIHPGASISELSTGAESIIGEEMKAVIAGYAPYMNDTLALAADSMVALAGLAEEDKAGFLSGRYWDVTEDLEELSHKGQQIESEDLYKLRIRKL